MAVLEIRHWFEGPAKVVVDQYCNESDPIQALKDMKAHLRSEFGRRNHSAKQMLDEILSGPQIDVKNANALQTFIFELQSVHKRAIETNRKATFDTLETFSMILTKKLYPLLRRWAVEIEKDETAWVESGMEPIEPTFERFLKFLNSHSRINFIKLAYRGVSSAESTVSCSSSTETDDEEKRDAESEDDTDSDSHAETDYEHDCVDRDRKFCHCCAKFRPSDHCLEKCSRFLEKDVQERKDFCKACGICFRCLGKGHKADQCTQSNQSCSICEGLHHTLLHD